MRSGHSVLPSSTAADQNTAGAADRDQLARDIAAIENAAAVLRKAEPALENWNPEAWNLETWNLEQSHPEAGHDRLAPHMLAKPRPIWLLIGALWMSTALVTLGAVFAISRLAG